MINLDQNTLQVPGKEPEPILGWRVVFCTMEGTCDTMNEVRESCARTGQSVATVMPLPAAYGEHTFEVCLKQTMLIGDTDGLDQS